MWLLFGDGRRRRGRQFGDLRQLLLRLFCIGRLSGQVQELLHMVFSFLVAGFLHEDHAQHVLELGNLV